MLKKFALCAVSISAVVILAFPSAAHAQETQVPLNQVPAWVLNAARVAANQFFGPSAVIVSAQTDPEGDFLTYEFTGAAPGILGFGIDVFPTARLKRSSKRFPRWRCPPMCWLV